MIWWQVVVILVIGAIILALGAVLGGSIAVAAHDSSDKKEKSEQTS